MSGFFGGGAIAVGSLVSGLAQGDLLVGGPAGALATVPDVAVGRVLVSGGVGVAPAWSASPTLTNLTLTGLTAGRVPLVGAGGLLTDTAQFDYLISGGQTYLDLNGFGKVGALNVRSTTTTPRTIMAGGLSIGNNSFLATLFDFDTTHRGDAANSAVDTADIFAIRHTTWSNNAAANLTASGAVFSVTNINTISAGSVTDSRPVIKAKQDVNSTGDIYQALVGATKHWSVKSNGLPSWIAADTQTTVGAAGGASALPVLPTGYLQVDVAGTTMVVPYYAAA